MASVAFIGRQPVLNRSQHILGYELLFRLDGQSYSADFDSDLQAGASVLANTLTNISTSRLIDNKLAFINVGERMINSDLLELLNPQQVILELVHEVEPSAACLARLEFLRKQGFGIALDDFDINSHQVHFLSFASYVKIDVTDKKLEDLIALREKVRQHSAFLIAKKVETVEQFQRCLDAGFDGFQGYFFSKAETLSANTINPNISNILTLLNLLRKNAEIHEIEQAMKGDVAMAYKLFRYINSAGFSLCNKITTFRQALTLLGYQKLYRWLTLLLVTASEEIGSPPALLKTAVTRGRFAELIGQILRHRSNNDDLFITGMFSLLDVLLDMPMEQVLEHLVIPDNVREALENHRGIFGSILQLVVACEDPQMQDVTRLSAEVGISPAEVNEAHLAALAWVEEIGI